MFNERLKRQIEGLRYDLEEFKKMAHPYELSDFHPFMMVYSGSIKGSKVARLERTLNALIDALGMEIVNVPASPADFKIVKKGK